LSGTGKKPARAKGYVLARGGPSLAQSAADMALRALRAATLALIPSLALAQTGLVTVNPVQVNQVDCAGTGSVSVRWTYTAVVTEDTFRLAANNSCSATAPTENGTLTLGPDVGPTVQSMSVLVSTIRSAVGAATSSTPDCAGINDTAVRICVYKITGGGTGTSILVDNAIFTFQTAVPPAPVNVTASPANQAIEVSYGAGTKAGNYQSDSVNYKVQYAAQVGDGGTQTWLETGETTSTTIRINNLVNGTTYDARVVALSSAGNPSPASATVSATPQPFLDYWTRYRDAGGREQGGCGAGGAGALALALVALAVFLRRRG
jgi:hypothetical protein